MPTKQSSYATVTELQDTALIHVFTDDGDGTFTDRNITPVALRRLANSVRVAQTTHGLAVGEVVRHNGTSWIEALADTAGNAVSVGIVTSVIDADTFRFAFAGDVTGLSGLTAGSVYYLQDAGGLGTTAGTVTVPVLLATSATTGHLILGGVA